MKRRDFLKALPAVSIPAISSCALSRIDPWHFLVRSDHITSVAHEREILSKAKLTWTEDRRIRVLYLRGTPYERGYQQGVILREEINDNLGFIYKLALKKFYFEELFAEVYERMRSFIPQEYIDEMHGLAHGARMPLHVVHHLHILASMGEWGGRKKIKKIIKKMMRGDPPDTWDLGTSCSNFSMTSSSTADGVFYAVRILDWGLHRISKLHEYPQITVTVPDKGIASANIGWTGFLGAVSGINAEGITLGEMGYGDPDNETLRGMPMVFLLRDVMSYSSSLADVRAIIGRSVGTNSFAFVMTDGKTEEAQLYIKDRERFIAIDAGQDARDGDEFFPAIPNVSYGGHYDERMTNLLRNFNGEYTLDMIRMRFIPEMAMKSNFQNVVYAPGKLQFWVNNAQSRKGWAADQPFTFFDFGKALEEYA